MVSLSSIATTEETKIASQPHNEFFALTLSNLVNVKLPAAHESEPDRATKFEYSTIARITLFSKKNGFFGRTYQSGFIRLDPETLKPVGDKINEYALCYSKFKDSDLHAIVEFVLVIKEKTDP